MTKRNIKLTLAYDGSAYFGWQKTRMGPSIEGELEKALKKVLNTEANNIVLQAASRTDRGVHAQGQVINFFIEQKIDLNQLYQQLNIVLPIDIRVHFISEVPISFHPSLDVIEKTYTYAISTTDFQNPFLCSYAWHVFHPINLPLMQEAASCLEGTHDFKGFTNKKCKDVYKDSIRTVHRIKFLEHSKEYLKIQITGNHFMYKMVRNLVGTLVFIGCKKLPIHVIYDILNNKKRAFAGMTAPAHGLTLMNINYDSSNKKCPFASSKACP